MNFNEWDGIFFDAVVANAILDRVLHHSHVTAISGKSYRLKDHIKQTDELYIIKSYFLYIYA